MRSSLSPRIVRTIIAPLTVALLLVIWVAVQRAHTLQQQTLMQHNQDYAHSLAALVTGAQELDNACRAAPASTRIMRVDTATRALLCDSERDFQIAAQTQVGGALAQALQAGIATLVLHAPGSGNVYATAIAPVSGTTHALVVATEIPRLTLQKSLGGALFWASVLVLLALLGTRRLDTRMTASLQVMLATLRQKTARASLPEFGRLQTEIETRLHELSQLTDTALEQRDELNFILDSMPESVLIFDRERRLLRYNESARRQLELRGTEGNGQLIESVVRHNGLVRFVDSVLQSRDAAFRETSLEWNNRATYAVSGVQVEWAGLPKAIIVLRDLTASKRLEQIKTDFVSNASHELQTPLTAIRGYSETLLDGAHNDAEVRLKFLDSIHRHAVRLEALVKDLLSLARIEREETALELIRQPLRPVAETVIGLVATRLAESGAHIDNQIPVDLTARLNVRLFEQALLNLVENAMKYSPRGSTITLRTQVESSTIHLEVIDNGPGIAAEHLPRLFERFYRVDPARSRAMGGTGLGLAIVKHVAIAHGGTVAVESRVGQGSRFRITLPYVD